MNRLITTFIDGVHFSNPFGSECVYTHLETLDRRSLFDDPSYEGSARAPPPTFLFLGFNCQTADGGSSRLSPEIPATGFREQPSVRREPRRRWPWYRPYPLPVSTTFLRFFQKVFGATFLGVSLARAAAFPAPRRQAWLRTALGRFSRSPSGVPGVRPRASVRASARPLGRLSREECCHRKAASAQHETARQDGC